MTEPTLLMLGSVQRVKGHWLMLDVLERLPRANWCWSPVAPTRGMPPARAAD